MRVADVRLPPWSSRRARAVHVARLDELAPGFGLTIPPVAITGIGLTRVVPFPGSP